MFACFVECQAKPGRGDEVSTKVTAEVVPILQKQPCFVDFIALVDKDFPERLLCVSLWTSHHDADNYHRERYDTIAKLLQPILESPPSLETFVVSASTVHRIAVRDAA